MPKILLEICCGSIDDAIQAEQGGADRVELCSALFLGGLTPSLGTLLEAKQRLKIPVITMIRPRAGGFCYSEAEFATMEGDAEAAVANDADGIVFGFLQPDGSIDLARTLRLRKLAGSRQAVFHRAFDVTPDPLKALDQLIDLNITRVLTSGQKNSVPEGADLIKRLIDYAKGRIEILPGGGIAAHNLQDVIQRTGAQQIHMTAWKTATDTSTHANTAVTFGGALYPSEDRYSVTDSSLVQQISAALRK